jgi:hypothetical protein
MQLGGSKFIHFRLQNYWFIEQMGISDKYLHTK